MNSRHSNDFIKLPNEFKTIPSRHTPNWKSDDIFIILLANQMECLDQFAECLHLAIGDILPKSWRKFCSYSFIDLVNEEHRFFCLDVLSKGS